MPFDEIAAEIDSVVSVRGPCLQDSQIQSLFALSFENGWHVDRLNGLLEAVASGTPLTPDVVRSNSVSLFQSASTMWSIVIGSFELGTINFVPNQTIAVKIDDIPIVVSRYTLPTAAKNEYFDRTISPQLDNSGDWRNSAIRVKSVWTETDALDYPLGSRPLFLVLSSRFTHNFEWVYERRTLRPLYHACVRSDYENISLIFELIAAADVQGSLEHVLPFVDHDVHYIRWEALKAIFYLNRDHGIKLLRRAVNDVHPDLRNAAIRNLELID